MNPFQYGFRPGFGKEMSLVGELMSSTRDEMEQTLPGASWISQQVLLCFSILGKNIEQEMIELHIGSGKPLAQLPEQF